AGLLDQTHVPLARSAGDGDAPAGVILVRVGAAKIEVLAIEEEAAVGGPFEPADAERRRRLIHDFAADEELLAERVKVWVVRGPQLRFVDRGRELLGRAG